jgi:hypothetical protein
MPIGEVRQSYAGQGVTVLDRKLEQADIADRVDWAPVALTARKQLSALQVALSKMPGAPTLTIAKSEGTRSKVDRIFIFQTRFVNGNSEYCNMLDWTDYTDC